MAQPGEIGAGTKCTPEIVDALCEKIRKGNPKEKACYLVGIAERTLYQWIEKGSSEDAEGTIYSVCVQAIKRAEAEFVDGVIDKVATEPKDWTRQAWLGERLQPSVFGKVDRLALVGDKNQPIGLVMLIPKPDSKPDEDQQ